MSLKIVKIAQHCCVRVEKEALCLLRSGYNIHIIANRIPQYANTYSSLTIQHDPEQLYAAIKFHSDADIFHCHNEPSWFVTAVKNMLPNKPVVLDVHDSMLIRVKPNDENCTRITADERNNFQLADALVFASDSMAEVCKREFDLNQPSIVLPPYVPGFLYRLDAFKYLGGIVYEGRVDFPDENPPELNFFDYCEYTKLASELHKQKMPFYIYTTSEKQGNNKWYSETTVWRNAKNYDDLIRKLGSHDWGLLGNIDEHPAWDHAMPNKLFEYLAAGIPVIAINAKEAGEFIEAHGFGMSVKTVEEIKQRWDENRECRKQVAQHSFDWCMEKKIQPLKDLYKKLI